MSKYSYQKYSYQLKKEVVQAYLEGKGGCAFLAKKHGIKSKSQIRRWIANYKAYEDKSLLRFRKQNSYSFETKLAIVQLYLSSELSYQDIAIQMGIMNASLGFLVFD
ncbi:helix-turn-helix domain-containing protein [Aerococcus christensenii]|uniref:helix-turn-helix domain-containing protein n=1 Tax=Aerococcus christensenii TaxID=87541 RepID=UPI000782ABFB|nr:helix-turn-helix domain-containing protein [Aerococcus christensenii]